MLKAILKTNNVVGKIVLSLAAVAVVGTVAKADEANLKAENQKAIDKLVETAPTDKELIGNVSLAKHTHTVEEPFSCSVALADRAELKRQLAHAEKLSKERVEEYSSTLTKVTKLIEKNKCEGK